MKLEKFMGMFLKSSLQHYKHMLQLIQENQSHDNLESGEKHDKVPSAYNNFAKKRRREIKEDDPTVTFGTISSTISSQWKELDTLQKLKYFDMDPAFSFYAKKRYKILKAKTPGVSQQNIQNLIKKEWKGFSLQQKTDFKEQYNRKLDRKRQCAQQEDEDQEQRPSKRKHEYAKKVVHTKLQEENERKKAQKRDQIRQKIKLQKQKMRELQKAYQNL